MKLNTDNNSAASYLMYNTQQILQHQILSNQLNTIIMVLLCTTLYIKAVSSININRNANNLINQTYQRFHSNDKYRSIQLKSSLLLL